jgi:hypothetical protein
MSLAKETGDDALSHEIDCRSVSLLAWENRWGEKRSFGEREAGLWMLRVVTPDLCREHSLSSLLFARVTWPRCLWAATLSVPRTSRLGSGPGGWERDCFAYASLFTFLFISMSIYNTVHVKASKSTSVVRKQLWSDSMVNAEKFLCLVISKRSFSEVGFG